MAVSINDNTKWALKRIEGFTDDALLDFVAKAKEATERIAPRRVHQGGNHASLIDFDKLGSRDYILFSASNYGAYLEFGTKFMAAQPHFRPSINKTIRQFAKGGEWGE